MNSPDQQACRSTIRGIPDGSAPGCPAPGPDLTRVWRWLLAMLLAGAGLLALWSHSAQAQGVTGMDLTVFDGMFPAQGVTAWAGDTRLGTTDDVGSLAADIPGGRQTLRLTRDGEELLNLDLLTVAGESVQVEVTLNDGAPPDVAINGTGASRPQVADSGAAPDSGAGSAAAAAAGAAATAEAAAASGAGQAAGTPEVAVTGDSEEPTGGDAAEAKASATVDQTTQAASTRPGALQGVIRSADSGAPVRNARLFFSGVDVQARTDNQGRFEVELPPGNYSVSIVHPDFASQTLPNVRVIPGQRVTTNLDLTPAGVQLQEYVVSAPYVEGSIASVVEQQREVAGVSEVLGAEQMSAAGDSDAAEALQRVTGLTVEDGRFVVIRGQPRRYTSTLWNGSPLPSIDPIKRIVPLDLFPTGVLSTIEVQKSFTANEPGSFGAGQVNLTTTGLPESGFLSLSAGTGFNTESTFEDGLTFDGGNDFLGFVDDKLDLPEGIDAAQSRPGGIAFLPEAEQIALAQAFSDELAPEKKTLPPDQSAGIAAGKSFDTRYGEFGIRSSFSWSREWRQKQFSSKRLGLAGENEPFVLDDFEEDRTDLNIQTGGMLVAGGRWDNHALTSNTFYIRDTTKRVEVDTGVFRPSDTEFLRTVLLEHESRELLLQQFVGEHDFDFLKLDWRYLTADGQRELPDRRLYSFTRDPGDASDPFELKDDPSLLRRFNSVEEDTNSFGVDLKLPVWDSTRLVALAEGGFSRETRDRNSETSTFVFEARRTAGDIEDIINDGTIADGTVNFEDRAGSADDYTGEVTIQGGYLGGDVTLLDRFRVRAGARVEQAEFDVTTFQNIGLAGVEPVESGFDQTEVLPSLLATWFATDTMQVRAGYSRSLSYPVLVEISDTTFISPATDETFNGNPDLEPATIDSVDLRWEWYPSDAESLTLGLFYKDYESPIERTFNNVGGGGERITFQNADEATVKGIEIGGRMELERLAQWTGLPWLEFMYIQANVAITDSEVTIGQTSAATNDKRALQGQADNVINFQLGYGGERHDWNISFNRVGRRLETAGINGLPDEFREAAPRLDAKWTYRPLKQAKISLTASNLINPDLELTQGDFVTETVQEGRSISLGLEYKFGL